MNSQQDATGGAVDGYNLPPSEASYFASSHASGLGLELAARQEMIRRHLLNQTLAAATASSTSGLAHSHPDAELDHLIRRENELLGLRSAHSQLMAGLGLGNNRMTADAHDAAGSGEDSFRNESIEAIVALQEQRRKQVEEMMGMPGRQLGEQAFNLLRERNQYSSLAGMTSSAAMASSAAAQGLLTGGHNLEPDELATASYLQGAQRRIEEQEALAFRNNGLGGGQAGMPSTLNYPNEYLHMLQLLQHQQQLSLLQMQSLAGHQGVGRAVPGSLLAGGLNRTQEQGGATTANTQSSVANPQNLTQVLVRDRLRYYNNGIEVDASGKPLKEKKQPVSPIKGSISKVQAHLSNNNDENLSVFVGLVLAHVPEMSHIMAGFLSSVKEMHPKSPAKRLSCVIDMAMDELNSIDQNDLMSIDPKCSDLASRVIACVNVIKAFRDKTNANKATEGASLKPKSSKKETTAAKRKKDEPKSSKKETAAAKRKKDDDLPLMQVYKRSKATKKSAKNSSLKQPHEVGKEDKLDARLQNAGSQKHPKTDQNTSELPKKQGTVEEKSSPTLKCNQALNTATKCSKEPSKSSNGPHGDLLGKLFSSDGKSEKEEKGKDDTTADPKSRNEKEGGSSDISKASSIADNASDDDLSAAGALLGLGK